MDGQSGEKSRNVVERMIAVMAEVGHIGKDRKAPGLNYAFRGIDDITVVVQPLFVKHGVIMTARVLEQVREQVHTSKGAAMISVRLTMEHTFRAPDGSTVVASAVGEALDQMDKASNKAMTAALKATLTTSFTIPVNDPEADTEAAPQVEVAHAPKAQAKPAATPPKAAPVDDLERTKGLARARFETSATEDELNAVWKELVTPMPPPDRKEMEPAFRARREAIKAAAKEDVPF